MGPDLFSGKQGHAMLESLFNSMISQAYLVRVKLRWGWGQIYFTENRAPSCSNLTL